MNYRMWGGTPPGHKPVEVVQTKSRIAKWIAYMDSRIGVEGGFRAAVVWLKSRPDVDGRTPTDRHVCRQLNEMYDVKAHACFIRYARAYWKKQDQIGGTMPYPTDAWDRVAKAMGEESLEDWLRRNFAAGKRAQWMAMQLSALTGTAVNTTTVRSWLTKRLGL